MKRFLLAGIAVAALSAAHAAPLSLTGSFVQVGISDGGTFGSNDSTPPGIRHDPTGLGNFTPGGIANDYLTPGSPHDGFSVNSTQTGFRSNDNQTFSRAFGTTSPTLTTVSGFSLAATWTGALADQMSITNTYFFNPNDERVNVRTTITALTDLTDLAFARSVDPDPDVNRFNDFDTVNTRGNGPIAPEDLVSSRGAVSGLFLAILNLSPDIVTNTLIDGSCCSNTDPYTVLLGGGPNFPATNTGDFGLDMAWQLGSLNSGDSVTINYAYVFGSRIEDVRPDPNAVPEPGTLGLLGLGLAALVAARRRRRAA